MAQSPRAVILAAGLGKRMRSARPKPLINLAGRPLIDYTVELATEVCGHPPVVVVNPAQADVVAHLRGISTVAYQESPAGTGDALRSVPSESKSEDQVLVLSADVPLLRAETLRGLLEAQKGSSCAILTFDSDVRGGYGRVYRDGTGRVIKIVEERDLGDHDIPAECNAGVYAFDGRLLWKALAALTNVNAQREYYLTDVIELIGGRTEAFKIDDPIEAIGINDRQQLALAEAEVRRRTLARIMASGVTVEDPATTYISAGAEIGPDSVIKPMSHLSGSIRLGRDCEIGPMAQLIDVAAGDRVKIGASVVEGCELGDDVSIGHYDRVRPVSHLHDGVSLGTHAEVKNSNVGANSRIGHFSCVLDADLGQDVNIGAGTVTCNFDGQDKHRTTIDDSVFVGSNSTLVPPLHLGSGSYVAAGSFVDRDVPAAALAVGRSKQRTVEGWASRRRPKEQPV